MRTLLASLLLFAATSALAHERFVVVNGQRLNHAEIARLEFFNCTRIPDGRYWLDPRSGAWGYAGSRTIHGYFGETCGHGRRHRSLSERGQLFTPYDHFRRW